MSKKPDHSPWFPPSFTLKEEDGSHRMFAWMDGWLSRNPSYKTEKRVCINHPLVTTTVPYDYHKAKSTIILALKVLYTEKYKNRSKGHAKPTKSPHYGAMAWKASYILRMMKKEGIELPKFTHALSRFQGSPAGDMTPEFKAIWDKDRVFRAVAMQTCLDGGTRQWDELMIDAMQSEKRLIDKLIKPFRRMMVEGRISVRVATNLPYDKAAQQAFLNGPKWSLGSAKAIQAALLCDTIRTAIKDAGRNPSSDIRPCDAFAKAGLQHEDAGFIRALSRAGGTVPTSIRGILKLNKDMHDPESATYKFIHNKNNMPHWKLSTALPPLPDLGVDSVELISTASGLRKEGKEMKHCVGGYVGTKGVFAHVKRGEDEVTWFVSPQGGYGSQCYGKLNRPNQLSADITREWTPVVHAWLQDTMFEREDLTIETPAISYE